MGGADRQSAGPARHARVADLRHFGGQLQGFWYAFGEQDGFALVELPDSVSAAAASAAVAATGSFRSLETTVLLTADEMVEALDKARQFAYKKPGG